MSSWFDDIEDAPIEWIGTHHKIDDNVHIGYNRLSKLRKGYDRKNKAVIINDHVTIRSGAIIYAGSIIGENSHIGHNVVMREFTRIGKNSSLGTGVVCEGYTSIGDFTTVHAQTHLTARMSIGDYCFIGPNVSTMNDRRIRYHRPLIVNSPDLGPIIGDGVAIGGGAIILPAVQVQMGVLIAAGAIVTKKCKLFHVYMGTPAKQYRIVTLDEVVEYLVPHYKTYLQGLQE